MRGELFDSVAGRLASPAGSNSSPQDSSIHPELMVAAAGSPYFLLELARFLQGRSPAASG